MSRPPSAGLRGSARATDEWVNEPCARVALRQAWTLEQQITLTSIAAPTGNETARARAVQRALRQSGLPATTVDRAGNVHAIVGTPGTAPLVCLAHLDTVYAAAPRATDPVPMERDGPLVRAPGIGDNGRGLAALLGLAHLLRDPAVAARLSRPVHLVATVGEEGEGNLRGARSWFDDAAATGMAPCAAIAIDGPGDATIVHHAVGSHRVRITLHGEGGHSWVHAEAANPIHALGEFIARAARLGNAQRRDAVVHVTRMHGGERLTAIPREAWVEVDVRGTSATRLDQVRRDLLRLLHDVIPPRVRAEVTVLGDRPAGSLDQAHPLVQAAVRATEAVQVVPRSAMASTDANIPLSRGIPAIAIGAGGTGGGAHTDDEWYDDTHGARGLQRLARLVLALAAD